MKMKKIATEILCQALLFVAAIGMVLSIRFLAGEHHENFVIAIEVFAFYFILRLSDQILDIRDRK